jgi:hypothetical protein
MTIDVYFNATDTTTQATWYRIQLYRNPSNSTWELYLNYTTVNKPSVPNDSNTWTEELGYQGISGSGNSWSFDKPSLGVEWAAPQDHIYFWTNKTNLSQGYNNLTKPNSTWIFADSHYSNSTLAGQSDRAPDSGIDPPKYDPRSHDIPEYDIFIAPVIGLTLFFIVKFNRRKRKKNKK